MPSPNPPVPQPVDLAVESVAGEEDPGAALDIPPANAEDASRTSNGDEQGDAGSHAGKLVPGR